MCYYYIKILFVSFSQFIINMASTRTRQSCRINNQCRKISSQRSNSLIESVDKNVSNFVHKHRLINCDSVLQTFFNCPENNAQRLKLMKYIVNVQREESNNLISRVQNLWARKEVKMEESHLENKISEEIAEQVYVPVKQDIFMDSQSEHGQPWAKTMPQI